MSYSKNSYANNIQNTDASTRNRAPRQTDVVGRATPVSAVSELQRAYKLTALARPRRSGGKCEKPAPLGFSHCRGVRHTHTLRVWMWLTARASSPFAALGLANHRRLRMVAGWKHLSLWTFC